MKNRFDLEEEIIKCWHITDDIDTVCNMIEMTDLEPRDRDKLLNVLIGIRTLYDHKFSQTMETMSSLIVQRNLL